MRFVIKFQYDGSKFFGFQRQRDKKSVQECLEKALTIINKKEVLIKGAGRTDVGVHANGQCAHFDLDINIGPKNLIKSLNNIVRPYINIIDCYLVQKNFHARFNVLKKVYVYKIWRGDFSPFKEDYFLQYNKKIDLAKIKECARLFTGAYNFHNFVSGERDNYDSIIYDIEVKEMAHEIQIIFTGTSFYRYMIRNLVGAMLDYNEGKCDIVLLNRMLKDQSFNYQLRTAPAKGLYLERIFYE